MPYGVGIVFTVNSVYKNVLNEGIMRAFQSGFMHKFTHDVEWEMMRSATGKLLQASSGLSLRTLNVEDRALTLDDTQGMFLLLGAGFLVGGAALLSEWFGGCFNLCKRRRSPSSYSIESNPRSYDTPTPRDKLNSISHYCNSRLGSIIDIEPRDYEDVKTNKQRSFSVETDEDEGRIITNHISNNLVGEELENGKQIETCDTFNFIVHSELNEKLEDIENADKNDLEKITENDFNNVTENSGEEIEASTNYGSIIDSLFNLDELFGEEHFPIDEPKEELNENHGQVNIFRGKLNDISK